MPLREGAAGGALFAVFVFCGGLLLVFLLPFLCRWLLVVCLFHWFVFFIDRIGQSAPAMARCRNSAAGPNATDAIIAKPFFLEGSCLC